MNRVMNADEIMEHIRRLPPEEFAKVQRLIAENTSAFAEEVTPFASRGLQIRPKNFEEAKRRVFAENRELFRLLAQ